jgi:hypothetical protein
MATGRKAFEGPSQAGVVAQIMERNPSPTSSVRPELPAPLDHVVQKCLAKDPEDRWQHAADLRDELKWIAQQRSQERQPTQVGRRWKNIALLSAALASVLLAMLLGLATIHFRERLPGQSRVVFTVPRDVAAFPQFNLPAVSPDGTRLVFFARGDGGRLMLWIRALDSLAAQPLTGAEISGAPPYPFWSPDGRFIGFFSDGKIKTIASNGGASQTLADAPDAGGGSWGPDGTIIFNPPDWSLVPRVGCRRVSDPAARARRVSTRVDTALASLPARWKALPLCREEHRCRKDRHLRRHGRHT